MNKKQSIEDQYEHYRQRRNKGFKQLFGGIGAILFGAGWILAMIAIAEFTDLDLPRALGFPGGLLVIGGLVGIIAGIADLIWAVVDDRPRNGSSRRGTGNPTDDP